jgi:hypothetical protein
MISDPVADDDSAREAAVKACRTAELSVSGTYTGDIVPPVADDDSERDAWIKLAKVLEQA